MTVGERLKQLREKSGMSQVDFAAKLNVSKQNLYKYENDIITNIPSDKIEDAAKILHVSPAYIMGWVNLKKFIIHHNLMIQILEELNVQEKICQMQIRNL